MESIDLLRQRIRAAIPKPTEITAIGGPSPLHSEILSLPEEELSRIHLCEAAESVEGMYFLPPILEYCAARREGFQSLIRRLLISLSDQEEHFPLGTYALLLRTLESIFSSWTSSFERNDKELQYYKFRGVRRLASPVADTHERDSYLASICRQQLSYRDRWFSELIFWVWAGDNMPERAAHLIDFLCNAATSEWSIKQECYREPAVVRLLADSRFCRWRWSTCADYFRSVVGDEYADEVQRVLVDERPGWLSRSEKVRVRDSRPRGYRWFFLSDEAPEARTTNMTQSAYVLAYLDAIKTRDAAFGHLQKMTTRANMLLHVMEDRHSQGVRAFGVSDKNSETPEFPQGPAIYDVADWPTGADFKQAYEDLNAGNEGVFTAWDAIPDVEREGLPQPNVLWPRKPQTREQAAQRRNKDSA